jgi:hypothetical protein
MADKKEEAKQDKREGGVGMEKDDTQDAEVAGRAKRILYTCWNDGAANYVNPAWNWFTCWRCGVTFYSDGKGGYSSGDY